ncbi:MAG: ATP synthase F1 subunit delta, partial [Chloroflexia bacterium]|nr:ATP synthase F1 subunit delta [Chloroflexia bacterium]
MASSAAKRYAQAVFSLGQEEGTLDAWGDDLAMLSRVVADERIADYLTNPSVAAERRIEALESSLGANVQPQARNLARMLIERDRTMLIPEIREMFDDRLRAERGIAIANVTTAEPLDDAERALVQQKLETMTGQTIELALKIDPE